ncbi:MAG: PQQ-binding-like beta-propeller repeat protein [Mangrovibacterium sp.]
MKFTKSLVATLCFFSLQSQAQDWPQFLGPERNNSSPQKNLLHAWPETGPEVLWTVPVGLGYGGPAVKNGNVYLLDRNDSIGDILRSFDLATGKELWKLEVPAPGAFPFPGSRCVPAVDETSVYACGIKGDLICVDIATHQLRWQKNIWTDFGGSKLPTWAISQCPLIYGDLVIVASQAPDAGLLAFNKQNGKLAWKTPNLGNGTYVSPTKATISGEDHLIMVTSSTNTNRNPEAEKKPGKIIGLHPLTGNVLWEYANWDCHNSVPNAIEAGDNKLLVVAGYELGCVMIKIEKATDGSYAISELFKHNEFGDQTKPPVLCNGCFYAQFGTNNKRDGLVCMDMDGNIKWKTKNAPGFNKGSMILADGLLLATDGADALYLIEPDPAAFKPLASVKIMKAGGVATGDRMTNVGGPTQNWAPIALADGKLLIRDQSRMLCLKVAE